MTKEHGEQAIEHATHFDVLPDEQARVARGVLEEEGKAREHLVVLLSGAHAYGFASPDSDLDLKAVHVAPTPLLVGLEMAPAARDRMEVIEGVEIDYTSNEVGPVLAGILGGNGNYVERILGAPALVESPLLEGLRPLVRAALSRRVYRHYAGFAQNQRKAAEEEGGTTAKRVLYVLRTALTGTHLLRAGEVVTDVGRLFPEYGFEEASALVAVKRAGERTKLSAKDVKRLRECLDRAMRLLEASRDTSVLPEKPSDEAFRALSGWLVALRKERF
ncbi:nucleotidyltransferase domain-containing protein [Polyangium sp. 6x1]|uniref:nucleotidyltransferase domain-containing protein n=1 Tax=Polyangium sp. 6x1 TaxID=3042689 RepID=UPI002482DEFC|nr:nucleotidyltransferase domain-containing protein [Polyangium sp. 6x1]MDI1442971.1 nucleotidyltransferase domain-containing protein [Polyangium sp. 6x1]